MPHKAFSEMSVGVVKGAVAIKSTVDARDVL